MEDKERIKELLSKFITASLTNNQVYGLRDGSEIKLNKGIYEIQHYLSNELASHGINARLDEKINSHSIIESFNKKEHKHLKAEYYAFPFLKFVYGNFKVGKDLLEYIDDFVAENKEALTWQDIIVTKTGATRCKTNIRFSLNLLRDLNLVRKRNEKDKRTMLPTVVGQLIVHYFDWINLRSKNTQRIEADLSFGGYVYFSNHLDRLREPTVMTEFLNHIKNNFNLQDNEFDKISKYLEKFTEIVLNALTISDRGIKYDSEIKTSTEYKQLLSNLNSEYIFLRKYLKKN